MSRPSPEGAAAGTEPSRPVPRTDAQPPLERTAPRVGPPADVAGGMPAIVQTLRHTSRHLGLVRGARLLLQTNQAAGFDCPGCAWPEEHDPRARAVAEFCENGAKAVASEATRRRAGPELFAAKSVRELAAESDFWLNEQGRLTHPMILRAGATHYEPLSWDEAFEKVARALGELASPDEAAFYTSGRTSNEAAFLWQAFARLFGTNNLPDCSNMCHESSGAGMGESLGVGKGTVGLEDFELADALFVVGQNPGTNHPRMLSTLRTARLRGCTVVAVNPLIEAGTQRFAHPQEPADVLGGAPPLAAFTLQVRIGGDQALFRALAKALLEAEDAAPGTVLDRDFLGAHTEGFEAYAAAVRATSWEELERGSGLSRAEIDRGAAVLLGSKRTIVCWAMGITQHEHAVANVQEIVSLLLLQGNVGRPGAGACPVRGHSNVQGDRTMGVWERMPGPFLDALGETLAFAPPRAHGLDVVDTIRAMRDGRVKVFLAMGGNFLSAAPDTELTAEGLRACALTVHVSTKLHRGHLVTGREALILPCLGRTERDVQASGPQRVSVESSMSVVSASEGHLEPASPHLKSEVAIVCGLARAAVPGRGALDWTALEADYARIRALVARVVPGFRDYEARLAEPGGFYLGNAARERTFQTPSRRAVFVPNPLPALDVAPDELTMMTLRSHDQYNTTVYGLDDRYRGIHGGRRVVFLHADDVAARGLSEGELVDLTSTWDGRVRRAEAFTVVTYRIPRGCAATYFPEANVLVPLGRVARKSNTPASKAVPIRVERRAPGG